MTTTIVKKYFHTLSDEEINVLLKEKITFRQIMDNYSQPEWCDYQDALEGMMGCWSLMDLFGLRKEISPKFCKNCDCFCGAIVLFEKTLINK